MDKGTASSDNTNEPLPSQQAVTDQTRMGVVCVVGIFKFFFCISLASRSLFALGSIYGMTTSLTTAESNCSQCGYSLSCRVAEEGDGDDNYTASTPRRGPGDVGNVSWAVSKLFYFLFSNLYNGRHPLTPTNRIQPRDSIRAQP